jgi:hypothetical protein
MNIERPSRSVPNHVALPCSKNDDKGVDTDKIMLLASILGQCRDVSNMSENDERELVIVY